MAKSVPAAPEKQDGYSRLILTRIVGSSVVIKQPDGKEIIVSILQVKGKQARLAFTVPDDTRIARTELIEDGLAGFESRFFATGKAHQAGPVRCPSCRSIEVKVDSDERRTCVSCKHIWLPDGDL